MEIYIPFLFSLGVYQARADINGSWIPDRIVIVCEFKLAEKSSAREPPPAVKMSPAKPHFFLFCTCEFKQISEANLLEHLRNGWTIVHKLSEGEVIVKHA
jgi:hypothetical protein